MLGEKIGEAKGRVSGQRVLSIGNGAPRIEVSFDESGTLLGVPTRDIATYWSEPTGPGTLYGEGNGVTIGPDGETATWRGSGVGKLGKGGAVSYRGTIFYSAVPGSKLARLNGLAVAFEFDVDAAGATVSRLWEWK